MSKWVLLLAVTGALAAVPAAVSGHAGYAWHNTPTGTTAHFRGLSPVSATTAWVSGYTATDGVVMRTTDRGATWQDVSPPGAAGLQFRDIEAFDANRAVAMSIGNDPSAFRIYVTADGGQTWSITQQNTNPGAFYDCMTFFNDKRGLLVSDPPDGQHFLVLATDDGGLHWRVTGQQIPQALPGEAAFAASGECITSHGGRAWFGTTAGRVFRSNNGGASWTVSQTSVASGSGTNGINAVAFRSGQHGLAVGGDFANPTASPNNFATTSDGGQTWSLIPGGPPEYRSGVTWVDGHTAIAVGLTGSDVSTDFGATWQRFDDGSLDTVACANPNACWASGASGRVAFLER